MPALALLPRAEAAAPRPGDLLPRVVRAAAMAFDRHLRHKPQRERFSRIV